MEFGGKSVTVEAKTADGWAAYVEASSRVQVMHRLGFTQSEMIDEGKAEGLSVSEEKLNALDADEMHDLRRAFSLNPNLAEKCAAEHLPDEHAQAVKSRPAPSGHDPQWSGPDSTGSDGYPAPRHASRPMSMMRACRSSLSVSIGSHSARSVVPSTSRVPNEPPVIRAW